MTSLRFRASRIAAFVLALSASSAMTASAGGSPVRIPLDNMNGSGESGVAILMKGGAGG
jgi:hypothetical protein